MQIFLNKRKQDLSKPSVKSPSCSGCKGRIAGDSVVCVTKVWSVNNRLSRKILITTVGGPV